MDAMALMVQIDNLLLFKVVIHNKNSQCIHRSLIMAITSIGDNSDDNSLSRTKHNYLITLPTLTANLHMKVSINCFYTLYKMRPENTVCQYSIEPLTNIYWMLQEY